MIIKYGKSLIDIRFRERDSEEVDLDVKSLYCPGKLDICCKDPEFEPLETVIEALFEKEEAEPVNGANDNIVIGEGSSFKEVELPEDKIGNISFLYIY